MCSLPVNGTQWIRDSLVYRRVAFRIALGGIAVVLAHAAAPVEAGVIQLGAAPEAVASAPSRPLVRFAQLPERDAPSINTTPEHGSLSGTGTVSVSGPSHTVAALFSPGVDLAGQIVGRVSGDGSLILPSPPPNSLFNPPRNSV